MKSHPCLFTTKASLLTRQTEPHHCQMLCRHYVFAVGFSTLKTNPNMFSFLQKHDLVGKVALLTNREKQHIVILGQTLPHSNLTNYTTQEARSLKLAKYNPLSERTPVPMVVCNEKQAFPFLHLGLLCN